MAPGQGQWPEDVGIIAIEIYFPSQYVDQTELETFDGASAGKYTIGLGQKRMGFCSDLEDINSLCMTVVHNLMDKTGTAYSQIGRLEVGTETIVDKSKSVKSVLMQLFAAADADGDVEGVDSTNACYGGTAALFNALNWVESSAWDGRLALVVCGDIAVYATGSARPTGGAGAVAMLVGPRAPLVVERGLRSSHMQHAYDFYKPNLNSEYPVVDGRLSIQCYLSALDQCYRRYREKAAAAGGGAVTVDSFDAVLFHSPFGKLVQKSLARLVFNDFLQEDEAGVASRYPGLETFRTKTLEESYFDRDVEKAFMERSRAQFEQKTRPSLLLASNVGNMYTPSLYSCLVSLLVSKPAEELAGSRIALFSYGSGLASSLFSIRLAATNGSSSRLEKLLSCVSDVTSRLESRQQVGPQVFADTMLLREQAHHQVPYTPKGDPAVLFPGTYYLTGLDDKHRRTYARAT